MAKTFRQYDSRWAYHKYPGNGDNMSNSGCGATAVADIIVDNPRYKKYTPENVRKYMVKHGYAIYGQGTAWTGITAALKHYGFIVKNPGSMKEAFELLDGKYNKGVIVFRAGTKGGVTWTSVGHYLAFSKYKKKNGKHYFYMRDPGPRKNDGWHCYEKHMAGLIPEIWVCYYPKPKVTNSTKKTTVKKTTVSTTYTGTWPKLPSRGYFDKVDTGKQVEYLQKFLKWYGCDITIDGIFGKETLAAVKKFQKGEKIVADGKFGKESLSAAKRAKKK